MRKVPIPSERTTSTYFNMPQKSKNETSATSQEDIRLYPNELNASPKVSCESDHHNRDSRSWTEMSGRTELERHGDSEELRKKLRSSQVELDNCQAQIGNLQSETARLRSQLEDQSAFCASLGAVLGNLVWKASRVPPVVDILLSGNKLGDFLCIVSGTLDSFLETFHTVMPGPTADESQFIMAMGGIVTNMAAAPAGRQYLVSDPNGRDLIQHIIRVVPAIPTPSGNCLKRCLTQTLPA